MAWPASPCWRVCRVWWSETSTSHPSRSWSPSPTTWSPHQGIGVSSDQGPTGASTAATSREHPPASSPTTGAATRTSPSHCVSCRMRRLAPLALSTRWLAADSSATSRLRGLPERGQGLARRRAQLRRHRQRPRELRQCKQHRQPLGLCQRGFRLRRHGPRQGPRRRPRGPAPQHGPPPQRLSRCLRQRHRHHCNRHQQCRSRWLLTGQCRRQRHCPHPSCSPRCLRRHQHPRRHPSCRGRWRRAFTRCLQQRQRQSCRSRRRRWPCRCPRHCRCS